MCFFSGVYLLDFSKTWRNKGFRRSTPTGHWKLPIKLSTSCVMHSANTWLGLTMWILELKLYSENLKLWSWVSWVSFKEGPFCECSLAVSTQSVVRIFRFQRGKSWFSPFSFVGNETWFWKCLGGKVFRTVAECNKDSNSNNCFQSVVAHGPWPILTSQHLMFDSIAHLSQRNVKTLKSHIRNQSGIFLQF